MNHFHINGKEFCITKKGKVLQKEKFGLEGWNSTAWLQVKNLDLVASDVDEPYLDINNPKIPFEKILFVREFFSQVYNTRKSEAFVYFSYDQENKEYVVFVPPSQKASGGHVSFDGHMPKYCDECRVGTGNVDAEKCSVCGSTDMVVSRIVGTAHSHGSMNAFHSSIDDANELDTTGFHITFGKLNDPIGFELAHSYVIARLGTTDKDGMGTRFKENLDICDLIELPFQSKRHFLDRWVSLVLSAPVIDALPKEFKVLTRKGEAYSIVGDETVYQALIKDQLIAHSGELVEKDFQILTMEELRAAISKAHVIKTQSGNKGTIPGSAQFKAQTSTHPPISRQGYGTTNIGAGTSLSGNPTSSPDTPDQTWRPLESLLSPGKTAMSIENEGHHLALDDDGRCTLKIVGEKTEEIAKFESSLIFKCANTSIDRALVFRVIPQLLLDHMCEIADGWSNDRLVKLSLAANSIRKEYVCGFGLLGDHEIALVTDEFIDNKGVSPLNQFNTLLAFTPTAIDKESTEDDIIFAVICCMWVGQEFVLSAEKHRYTSRGIALAMYQFFAASAEELAYGHATATLIRELVGEKA